VFHSLLTPWPTENGERGCLKEKNIIAFVSESGLQFDTQESHTSFEGIISNCPNKEKEQYTKWSFDSQPL
jgi:hypothetical protein